MGSVQKFQLSLFDVARAVVWCEDKKWGSGGHRGGNASAYDCVPRYVACKLGLAKG
jgi:hypothetical protein